MSISLNVNSLQLGCSNFKLHDELEGRRKACEKFSGSLITYKGPQIKEVNHVVRPFGFEILKSAI
jgi:adenylate cyclase class IV